MRSVTADDGLARAAHGRLAQDFDWKFQTLATTAIMNKNYYYFASALILLVGLFSFLTLNKKGSEEKAIVQTTMPSLDNAFAKGATLYAENCAQCHGKSLGGVVGSGPPLAHPYYNPGHHGDKAFYRAVENGVQAHHWQFGNMPKIDSLTRRDVQRIIEVIRRVQRANGIS